MMVDMHGRYVASRGGFLDGLRPGEQTAVDSIDDGLRGNLSATEEASVKTLDSILPALHSIEFQVNVALRVGI